MRIWLGRICVAFGVVLLLVSVVGLFQRPAEQSRATLAWDRVDLALDHETQSYSALRRLAASKMMGTDEQKALVLLDLMSRRFVNGLSRENLFTSYPQFLLGGPFRASFSRDRILRLGNQGFCSQQSYVLVQLANDLGLPARQVGLNGHVVAEVWYGGDWHMLDPAFEIAIRDGQRKLASVAALERDPARLMVAYGNKDPKIVRFYVTRQDNSFVSYPPGSYFVWKAQVLLYVAKALEVLKWLLPVALLGLGWWLLRARRRQPTT